MADPGLNTAFEKPNSVFSSHLVMRRVNCCFPEWDHPFSDVLEESVLLSKSTEHGLFMHNCQYEKEIRAW